MTRSLDAFSRARIVVVGDVMLDRYWQGRAARISPEAPVPIVRVTAEDERPGGAANVAVNAAVLGAKVVLVSATGSDAAAAALAEKCRGFGVETRFVEDAAFSTTVKLRVLAQHQQLLRLDFEADAPQSSTLNLLPVLNSVLSAITVVVLSDYGKGALHNAAEIIAIAKAAQKTVIVDPKGRDFARYHGADLITPNLAEFEAVVGPCADHDELAARGQALCAQYNFGAVLVTRGEQGMSLVLKDAAALHLAARARDVFDVTGAGDTVCAVLGCGLGAGLTLEQAVEIANAAAGIAVGKLGTATVSRAELAAALDEKQLQNPRFKSRSALLGEIAKARARGERVVMTNGCFDVLHAGHVRYLVAAAELADRLLVAVNSDASVQRLKGSARPINPLAARVEVLTSLRAVDWVIAFDDDTPRDLIAEIEPDVLVKGGDYDIASIAGAAEVIAAGGRVLTLPYHAGFSSTTTIERAGIDPLATRVKS
ncbi:MAG: bifunctional D-glycero-beta-D-manno-heptose-7-phosphate kinase/D-glycero-beta-D-manno-heptose 1-phosphate adenylyltransferase HldE [Gammaproteobacteria bacterium]|nr:bifunctional D-glycero-beta-D-manno-heptose-7-phosphate kinase/D-glycero-beta-D-manno-heptose 1-phosphate adenylyltransferase HldE [Gammaproteobacteria bacterium]